MEELEKAKLLSVATKLAKAEIQEVRDELLEQINSIQIPEAIDGRDGRGIVDARIFEGQLILQLSDGALVTAGSVIGEQGLVGPIGARGEKGDKGDPGPRGDKGDHGAPGLDGAKGEKGDKGDTGKQGERGERGEQGVPGERGERGERGKQGPKGADGADGSAGRDGAKGDPGEKGDQGVPGRDGKNGKDGAKGLKGDKGDQGEKGDKGDPGSDANTKELEKKFDKLIENVDKRFSRFSYSAATGVKHTGSGEVWLHRLDDVDYHSVKTPSQGQALVWNNTLKKWQANNVVGTGGSITVSKVITDGSYTNTVTNVTGLRFDDDSGFDVVDLGNGDVKVQMNSTFKYWNVNGASGLTAVGLDTANFIAGSGITISANPANNSITFTSTGGGGTANLSSYLQVANANARFATKAYAASNTYVKQLLANTNVYIANINNNERAALANTNAYIATRATWSALTSTNTALRLYINNQIAAVVNSAPGVLDTLRELANALANDENYAVHTASLIATKQSVANSKVDLANTNLYIQQKLSVANAKIWLANTNAYIATRASWSELKATNTALRTLISDRMQVANVKFYLANTNSFIKSQLANTNLRIDLVNTNLTQTNTALRTLINDRLQVANADARYATKAYAAANSYVKQILANTNLYIETKITNAVSTTLRTRSLVPEANVLYDIGSNKKRYNKLWLAGDTIVLGTANLSSTPSGQLIVTGTSGVPYTIATEAIVESIYIANSIARTLINDRLQVANANAKFASKAYAASNSYVNTKFAPKIEPYFTGTIHSSNAAFTDTLRGSNATFTNVLSGDTIKSTRSYTWWGGQIDLALPVYTHGAGLNGSLRMDYYEDRFRIYESASPYRGVYLDLRYMANNVGTNLFGTGATWTALTSTNTALRTLISDRIQVANANAKFTTKAYAAANTYVKQLLANTNSYIATKASWTGLTGTNTALRLLINDRIQVANANAKYTTKAYAASNAYVKLILANTNAYIADVAASVGGGGGGGYAGETIDYGSIVTAIDIELNRDYGTL
jgi:hypothetical protein